MNYKNVRGIFLEVSFVVIVVIVVVISVVVVVVVVVDPGHYQP